MVLRVTYPCIRALDNSDVCDEPEYIQGAVGWAVDDTHAGSTLVSPGGNCS